MTVLFSIVYLACLGLAIQAAFMVVGAAAMAILVLASLAFAGVKRLRAPRSIH